MFKFLDGLDADIRQSLLNQLRDLWTHNSTALEGNSLTLGETSFVIAEGLTVSGKPFKDHEEVVGHARAIDLIYAIYQLATGRITSTTGTWPDESQMAPFVRFCEKSWDTTRQLVERAMRQQRSRRS